MSDKDLNLPVLHFTPPTKPEPKMEKAAPLVVFTPDERELVLFQNTPVPSKRRADTSKLQVKREKKETKGNLVFGLGAYSKPGKTARDKGKAKTGKKTNDPSISQKMKGQKGTKK